MRKHKFNKGTASIVLTCLGGVGVVATTVTAVRATPKALRLIEEAEKEKGEKLSKWETIQAAAPTYLSTVLIGTGTIACIFGASILTTRQQASLTSAYALLDQNYKRYRQKVVELYGEEAHNKIVESIAAEDAHEVYPCV